MESKRLNQYAGVNGKSHRRKACWSGLKNVNELLKVMAKDMDLQFYDDESFPSYAYRIIYSALGLWCLHSAASIREGTYGME